MEPDPKETSPENEQTQDCVPAPTPVPEPELPETNGVDDDNGKPITPPPTKPPGSN